MAIARFGFLGVERLEQHDVAIEQFAHAADQTVGEPQQHEAHPREPDDRQDHPQKPERPGHPGDPGRPPERARAGG